MRSNFTNQSRTSSTAVRAIDALVAISTTMLAGLFILAVVLPPVASALVG